MAVTFRTMMNRVLRAVGEEEVDAIAASLTSDYHKLVASFVNMIKEEIEAAHNWRSLRVTNTVSVTAATSAADIAWGNERSRVYRVQDAESGEFKALAFDTTVASNPIPLQEMSMARLLYNDTINTSPVSEPSFFAVDSTSAGDTVRLVLDGPVTTTRTISLTLIVPQARLADTDLDTVIKIPARPLELGAIWFALMERGEELGANALFTEERYRNALDDTVSLDAEEQGGYNLVVT